MSEKTARETIVETRELKAKSTRVVAWYGHSSGDSNYPNATVRGPFNRWFKVEEPSPEYKKHVAFGPDDANYAAHALNYADRYAAATEKAMNAFEKIKMKLMYSSNERDREILATAGEAIDDIEELLSWRSP